MELGERVADVQKGREHVLALTESGRVFAWGENAAGQLGLGDVASRFEPCEVLLQGGAIKQVLCFGDCSFALSTKGDVYAWGDNGSSQSSQHNGCSQSSLLALETSQPFVTSPTPILLLHPNAISKIECIQGTNGEKTMIAYVDYAEEDEGTGIKLRYVTDHSDTFSSPPVALGPDPHPPAPPDLRG